MQFVKEEKSKPGVTDAGAGTAVLSAAVQQPEPRLHFPRGRRGSRGPGAHAGSEKGSRLPGGFIILQAFKRPAGCSARAGRTSTLMPAAGRLFTVEMQSIARFGNISQGVGNTRGGKCFL